LKEQYFLKFFFEIFETSIFEIKKKKKKKIYIYIYIYIYILVSSPSHSLNIDNKYLNISNFRNYFQLCQKKRNSLLH